MSVGSVVKRVPYLGKIVNSFYIRYVSKKTPTYWINRYLKNQQLNVVQIGSNDGKTGDPIFELIKKKSNWQALFVEPVPYLFDRLKKNYNKSSRFAFANVAINEGKAQAFYSIKEEAKEHIPDLPDWYDQLNSFERDSITKHLGARIEPFIVESMIMGLTLESLFHQYNIETLELLHIDTEGYDFKILSQLDLKKYRPNIVLFEYKHLSYNEREGSIAFLQADYYIFNFHGDYLCLRKSILSDKDLIQLRDKLVNK